MAEEFALSSLVVPGTFIRVRAEGLIGVGGISAGNVGIVGTAAEGLGETHLLSDYRGAQETFGRYDAAADATGGQLNLVRALELLFRAGARTVYARGLAAAGANQAAVTAEFEELVKDDIQIVLAPELATADAIAVFTSLVESQENRSKDLLAVVGSDATAVAEIIGDVADKRIVLAAPGLRVTETVLNAGTGRLDASEVTLDGRYSAAAVGGLISTLAAQSSPTNKVVRGLTRLSQRFSYDETKNLINGGVLVLEERLGVRAVRGVTSEAATNGPFSQITTRRIVDFAKAGIRRVSQPFIGRLNNQRVRKALEGALNGFLTTMVQDEALVTYTLEVTADRSDEINGRARVNAVLQPTFSIDFIAVTLVLE